MLNYSAALQKIFDNLPTSRTEVRTLLRARGHYLAESVRSPIDLPSFNNSAMDGYALCSRDTVRATVKHPVTLRLIGESLAGHSFTKTLKRSESIYITTGAMIPDGADSVVRVELVKKVNSDSIQIRNPVRKSNHIRFVGDEIKSGELLFNSGEQLTPAHLGLLASIGKTSIKVYRRPTVGFLATGNELIAPELEPEPGQIRNCNTTIIRTLVEDLGFEFHDFGLALDTTADLLDKIKHIILPDIFITSAGVSVGEYDLVANTLAKMGLKVIFWKVAVKPGKPLLFGKIANTLFFGLPGNPVSAAVVFQQFIEPALHAISGCEKPFKGLLEADAEERFGLTRDRVHFARGIASYDNGWRVKSAGKQQSHILSALAAANCYILIPPDKEIKAGDRVYIQRTENSRLNFAEFRKALALFL